MRASRVVRMSRGGEVKPGEVRREESIGGRSSGRGREGRSVGMGGGWSGEADVGGGGGIRWRRGEGEGNEVEKYFHLIEKGMRYVEGCE